MNYVGVKEILLTKKNTKKKTGSSSIATLLHQCYTSRLHKVLRSKIKKEKEKGQTKLIYKLAIQCFYFNLMLVLSYLEHPIQCYTLSFLFLLSKTTLESKEILFRSAANSFKFFRDCLYLLLLIQRIKNDYFDVISDQTGTRISIIQVFNRNKEFSQIQT